MHRKKIAIGRFGSDVLGRAAYFLVALIMVVAATDNLGASQPTIVVVRHASWAGALDSWVQHRQGQGYRIEHVDAGLGRDGIQAAILQHCVPNDVGDRFVLLCGDITDNATCSIPTFGHESKAMVQFGGDAILASDNNYVDFNGDGCPDAAIGRIPADSPAQLKSHLERIILYEKQRDFGPWRRRVNVVAGVGGFGVVADTIIESTTKKFLGDRIPGWADVTMTQASLTSHYCPDPRSFAAATMNRLNEGSMFWVYIGHGHVKNLDYMRVGREYLPILTTADLPSMNVPQQSPIAIFLACYTGACDALEDSLAERMVLSETGPIAAIAASRVSGPYGLAMLADGMLDGYYQKRTPTLGQVLLQAKREVLVDDATLAEKNDENMQMIGAIAQALSPKGYELLAERQEHVFQVQLIGDPSLRLRYPTEAKMTAKAVAYPGDVLDVAVETSLVGQLSVELVYRRTASRRELALLPVDVDSAEGRENYQQRYDRANNTVVTMVVADVELPGTAVVQLPIPEDLSRGRYAIRTFLASEQASEAGYRELSVRAK